MHRAVESEDASETEALLSAAEQGQAGPGKFFYFTTFVQAALIVHELRLLDLASVRQVSLTWALECLISHFLFSAKQKQSQIYNSKTCATAMDRGARLHGYRPTSCTSHVAYEVVQNDCLWYQLTIKSRHCLGNLAKS